MKSLNPERMVVALLLCGKRFELGASGNTWGSLGRLAYAKPGLPVDNVRIFEAGWEVRRTYRNLPSLEKAVDLTLCRVVAYKAAVRRFVARHKLRVFLDCYIEYRVDAPLINLSDDSIRLLAYLNGSFGLEVVKLPVIANQRTDR